MSTRLYMSELPRSMGSGLRKVVRVKDITGNGSITFPELDEISEIKLQVIGVSTSEPSAKASVTGIDGNVVDIVVEEEKHKDVDITGTGTISFPDIDTIHSASLQVLNVSTSEPSAKASITGISGNAIDVIVEEDKHKEGSITGNGTFTFGNLDTINSASADVVDAATALPSTIATISGISGSDVSVVVIEQGSTSNAISGSSKTVRVNVKGVSGATRTVRANVKGKSGRSVSIRAAAIGRA